MGLKTEIPGEIDPVRTGFSLHLLHLLFQTLDLLLQAPVNRFEILQIHVQQRVVLEETA